MPSFGTGARHGANMGRSGGAVFSGGAGDADGRSVGRVNTLRRGSRPRIVMQATCGDFAGLLTRFAEGRLASVTIFAIAESQTSVLGASLTAVDQGATQFTARLLGILRAGRD